MVTLKEVAVAAQVSTVTASSVLSGVNRVRVSVATADRIRQIAKNLNYVPLAAARGLRTGRTRIIAFVAASRGMFNGGDAWHESLRGVSDVMWEREERLMLVRSRNSEHEHEIIRQMAYGRQVDGFVIEDAGEDDGRVDLLVSSERPFVVLGGVPRPGLNSVSFDMRSLAADIAAALLNDDGDGGCGGILVLAPQNADPRLYDPFFDFLAACAADAGAEFKHWRGAFVPAAADLAAFRKKMGGKRIGVALLRGLLPEMVAALGEAGLAVGTGASVVYVSAGEDVLMTPEGVAIMHFDNYTLGRRAARLLLKIVDAGKAAQEPESMVIPAAQES